MTNDEVKKDFEAWALAQGYCTALEWINGVNDNGSFSLIKSGKYKFIQTQMVFETYQSAHASQQARIDALEARLAEVSKDANSYKTALESIENLDCQCDGWEWCHNNYQSLASEAIKKDKQ